MNNRLIEYFRAFEHSNKDSRTPGRITQKEIADSGEMREASVSDVFRFLRKQAEKPPKPSQEMKVLRCLEEKWVINQDGFLVRKDTEAPTTEANSYSRPTMPYPIVPSVKVHADYPSGAIGTAVGHCDEILIINTYLSRYILNPEAKERDPETLLNWLEQGKKVKVLILQPEQHAMQLRAKSLSIKGSELANHLISNLTNLIGYVKDYPAQLEVRLMDEIPGVSAVILKDVVVFYGLHLSFGHTENVQYVEMPVQTECKSYDNIVKHFNTIWNDPTRARPLTDALLKNTENALHGIRNLQDTLTGTWDVYLHDLSDVLKEGGTAPFDSVVGPIIRWSLEIINPDKGVYLRAKLKLPGEMAFEARLVTGKLKGEDYAHIRYTNFQNLTLHFSFRCRPDRAGELLLGYFLLNTGSDSCSGYVVFIKNTGESSTIDKLPTYFRRLLSFRDGSYFSLARVQATRERFGLGLDFAGTYRVYSYGGRKGGSKGIKINWLHIDDAGIVRYKNQRFTKGDELTGRATYIAPNLHIMSTYYRRGVAERRGYLIAKVANNYPVKGRFYGAVHLGVSFEHDQIPNGKRFILEYVEDVKFEEMEHAFLPVHSPEYKKLPASIRGLLSGRVKNLNGFLRRDGLIADLLDLEEEWEESIKLGLVFYDSAVQHARRGEYGDAMDMISRAVYHGLDNLINFEEEVREFDEKGLEVMQKLEDYHKIRSILNQDTDHPTPAP